MSASAGRPIALARQGNGNYAGTVPVMRDRGRWRIDVIVTHLGHVVGLLHFWLALPLRSADSLIVASDQAGDRLNSAAINEVTEDEGRVTRSRYMFAAPDIEFATDAQGPSISSEGMSSISVVAGHRGSSPRTGISPCAGLTRILPPRR